MLKFLSAFLLALFFPVLIFCQKADSVIVKKDSIVIKQSYNSKLDVVLSKSNTLAYRLPSVAMKNELRTIDHTQNFYFYLLATLVLLLASLKVFYHRYFNNLFRVFFNTSLRQSQLTDQLLQVKLPSLLFNLFFVVTAGIYVCFLLKYYHWITDANLMKATVLSIFAVAVIYGTKYVSLKFTGWLTGLKDVGSNYIFIVFLINKVIGIFLLPVVIIIAFSEIALVNTVVTISIVAVIIMLLLRFYRSYGFIQNKLKVSRFHFFIYLLGVEVLPILLIYKCLTIVIR